MAAKFQWPWQSWRTSLVSGLRRLVRLELALSEERQDKYVSKLLTSLESQVNQRFHRALEESQNNLRRQISFELADVIEVERDLARAIEKLNTESVRPEHIAELEARISESLVKTTSETEELQRNLKALLSFQSHDIVEMLPERLVSALEPRMATLSIELGERTDRAAHRATVEAAGLSAVIDDMRETLAGQNERLAGSQHRNALILDELRTLSSQVPANVEAQLATFATNLSEAAGRLGLRFDTSASEAAAKVEALIAVLVAETRTSVERLAQLANDGLAEASMAARRAALEDISQVRDEISVIRTMVETGLERSAHRATTELTGLSALIDDMRDMIMGQNDRISATQYNQASALEAIKGDLGKFSESISSESKAIPSITYDLISARLLAFENLLSKIDHVVAEIRLDFSSYAAAPEVHLNGLASSIGEQAANRTFDIVSPRLLLLENLLSKVDNAAAEIRMEVAAPKATPEVDLGRLTSDIVEQTANLTFDLVSNRLLPIANKSAEIENGVAEARLAIAQGSELTSNLVKHLTTSVHSRLNEWENERLPAVVSQMHEVAAIGLAGRASDAMRDYRSLPDERYKPAKAKPFDRVLEQASRDYPHIYPEWKVRLDEIKAAFAETKIGNAANARDLYSNMFADFVGENAKGRILDVGSGVFGRPYYLRRFPAELVSGIEPLPLLEPADFELVQGIGEYLPWPDESFSTVTSGTSLDHCMSLERTFDEIVRVLTPTGRALFWIDSIAGSPAYVPDAPYFSPVDRFHLFHFDMAWLEPMLEVRFEIAQRHIFDRPGFSKVFYALHRAPVVRSARNV